MKGVYKNVSAILLALVIVWFLRRSRSNETGDVEFTGDGSCFAFSNGRVELKPCGSSSTQSSTPSRLTFSCQHTICEIRPIHDNTSCVVRDGQRLRLDVCRNNHLWKLGLHDRGPQQLRSHDGAACVYVYKNWGGGRTPMVESCATIERDNTRATSLFHIRLSRDRDTPLVTHNDQHLMEVKNDIVLTTLDGVHIQNDQPQTQGIAAVDTTPTAAAIISDLKMISPQNFHHDTLDSANGDLDDDSNDTGAESNGWSYW